jgi:hypothetical protein
MTISFKRTIFKGKKLAKNKLYSLAFFWRHRNETYTLYIT